ncbi:hypothetical protein [Streptomyces fradiae]|uniref:hypothetical protein n=1 Tax=Streptomyces fradiae TaxID=1906 RepID=UPI003513B061
MPVLDGPLKGVRVDDLVSDTPYAKPPEWTEDYARADERITVPCPNGLPGYPRPVTTFRVYGTTDAKAREWLGSLVAAVAEDVRKDARCGRAPVRDEAVQSWRSSPPEEEPDGEEECGWFRPELLGPAWKDAHWSAKGGTHAWARACATTVGTSRSSVAVSSATWWGEALPEARVEYGRELAAVGKGAGHGDEQQAGEQRAGEKRAHRLAVWAEARCAGGPALHRLSLEGTDRALLAARADSFLTRSLDASGDCDGIEVLGKVWG